MFVTEMQGSVFWGYNMFNSRKCDKVDKFNIFWKWRRLVFNLLFPIEYSRKFPSSVRYEMHPI